MEEPILDKAFERLKTKLPYLWNIYNFHLVYFTRDYGMYHRGFLMGLENDICRIAFRRDHNSVNEPMVGYVGTKKSPFAITSTDYLQKDGWYPLSGLVYRLSGVDYQFEKNVDLNLQDFSEYIQPYMDSILELLRVPEEIDKKLEDYRNLNKENQITVEKIREERARLQALGQDSSLEAAITSLRGGKK
jgi:hypothetical protein